MPGKRQNGRGSGDYYAGGAYDEFGGRGYDGYDESGYDADPYSEEDYERRRAEFIRQMQEEDAIRGSRKGKWLKTLGIIVIVAAVFLAVSFFQRGKFGSLFGGTGTAALDADLSGKGYVVCIDPGHGGSDPGAVSEEIRECDVDLAVALELRDILEDAGVTVVMTRETDTFVELRDRAETANEAGADLFIAIHMNIVEGDTQTNGIETWLYSADDAETTRFAALVQSHAVEATGAADRGLFADPSFAVIRLTQMPAVLFEGGCMSNVQELSRLIEKNYQHALAYGIAEGIAAWFSGEADPGEYTVTVQQ